MKKRGQNRAKQGKKKKFRTSEAPMADSIFRQAYKMNPFEPKEAGEARKASRLFVSAAKEYEKEGEMVKAGESYGYAAMVLYLSETDRGKARKLYEKAVGTLEKADKKSTIRNGDILYQWGIWNRVLAGMYLDTDEMKWMEWTEKAREIEERGKG